MISENESTSAAPTVIPAPPGLTAIDADGKALPIVALLLQPDDDEYPAVPLYLAESGGATRVWRNAKFGLSEAWTPVRTVDTPIHE